MNIHSSCFRPLIATIALALPIVSPVYSQNKTTDTSFKIKKKKGVFKLELAASAVSPGKFVSKTGKYSPQSNIQSSYSLGFIYSKPIGKTISFEFGAGLEIGKRNYFVNIPASDNNGFNGKKLIEDKELWTAIRLPIIFEKRIKKNLGIKTGLVIRFSGFSAEEEFTVTSVRANNQAVKIFKSKIDPSNGGKPWAAFLLGVSKFYSLKNHNLLSICLRSEVSFRNFINGNYEITIPNQPISTGTYNVNGSLLGLYIQYVFTGENKRIVRGYQKKSF